MGIGMWLPTWCNKITLLNHLKVFFMNRRKFAKSFPHEWYTMSFSNSMTSVVKYFLSIWPSTTMKTCPIVKHFSQILPNIKQTLRNLPETFKIVPNYGNIVTVVTYYFMTLSGNQLDCFQCGLNSTSVDCDHFDRNNESFIVSCDPNKFQSCLTTTGKFGDVIGSEFIDQSFKRNKIKDI